MEIIQVGDSDIGTRKFGGIVYNISCDFGGVESPSTLTMSIVSDGGILQEPALNSTNPIKEKIKIGAGKVFNGYRVSWRKDISPDREILEVKYFDGSYRLDQYLIGLKFKHGRPESNNGRMILLGKEFHPCDEAQDSLTPFSFDPNKREIDWCDPCPFCPAEKYERSCAEPDFPYMSDSGQKVASSKILPVKYTYNEFFEKIKGPCKTDHSFKPKIGRPVDHTGSVRDVLSSFCSENGFTWYWDFFDDRLKLVDLKVRKDIPTKKVVTSQNLTEYTQSQTIENTNSSHLVLRYEKEGGSRSFSCSDKRLLTLVPVTIDHLIDIENAAQNKNIYGGVGGENNPLVLGASQGTGIRLDILASLAYYSQAMWECAVYYNGYKLKNHREAEKAIGYNLTYLGDMKIKHVYKPEEFSTWSHLLPEDERNKMNELNAAYQASLQTNVEKFYWYFIVVDVSLESLSKEYERNQNLAQNFLGQYWVRRYDPVVCGGRAKSSDVSIEAPDGSGTFHSYGESFDGSGLAQIGYEEGSAISKLISEAATNVNADGSEVDFEDKKYKTTASFVMVNREAKWFPNSQNMQDYQHVLDWFEDEAPKLIGSDGRPEKFVSDYVPPQNFNFQQDPDSYDPKKNKNLRLMLIKAREEEFVLSVKEQENWYEKTKGQEIFHSSFRDGNRLKPVEERPIGRMGLTDNKSYWVTFHQFGFLAPVGSYFEYNAGRGFLDNIRIDALRNTGHPIVDRDALEENLKSPDARYRVAISQNSNVQRNLPKIEYVETSPDGGGLKTNLLEIQVEEKELQVEGQCMPSQKRMKEILNESLELKVNASYPSEDIQFKLAGIYPEHYSIEDGLDSFSISVDENGFFTNYNLSSKYAQPISQEMLKLKNRINSINSNAPFTQTSMKDRIQTVSPGEISPLPLM